MNRLTGTRVGSARGVTLVELMVVIAILAILAAIVSPSVFGTLERQRAAGVARDVANELRRARNQAMSRGEIIIVEFTNDNGGTLTTYATDTALESGDPATQTACPSGDSDCPDDTTCQDGKCYGEPARSCRQYDTSVGFERQVAQSNLLKAPDMELKQLGDLPMADARLCFSPDGRVLDTNGLPIADAEFTCPGEDLVLIVADVDATAGEVDGAAPCADAQDDQSVTDARDAINLYRVAVPFNGAIKVKQ